MPGFTDVILTPHYITDYYETPGGEVVFWKNSLQKILDTKNIKIKLHSGMEIYISDELESLLKKGEIIGLANSKYLLIELPMHSDFKYTDEILFMLKTMGYKVIIAHPERYKVVQENIEFAQELINKGCLLQANFGSIAGLYGKDAKKTINKLLKLNLISFMGSDTHRPETIYKIMPKIIKKLKKTIPNNKLYEITTENPSKILNDEAI